MANIAQQSLRSKIREDYLTCAICFNQFTHPKALPCLHTFCLGCLKDYVASNFKELGVFPCPTCRKDVNIPPQGLEGLQENYMVASLLDTVDDNSLPSLAPQPNGANLLPGDPRYKPVPAPRSISPRFLGVHGDGRPVPAPRSVSPQPSCCTITPDVPPRPKSTNPVPGFTNDQSSENPNSFGGQAGDGHQNTHQPTPVSHGYQFSQLISGGIGGVVGAMGSALTDISGYLYPPKPAPANSPTSPFEFVPRSGGTNPENGVHPSAPSYPGMNPPEPLYPGLYPQLPANENLGPCTESMLLRFGKFGSGVNDLMKPFGLGVGQNGEFVLSDRGGNRVFVFSNTGELKSRFNLNCTVNGIAITKDNQILIAVAKSGSNIMRMYSMEGRLLQGIGDYYKFDVSSGITITKSNHVAITNLAADNVLIFTDQRKFSTKFGWKGRGQNHFMQPSFVTATSKDYIVVSDTGNDCIKLFDIAGNFKRSFGSKGSNHNQLDTPLGVATDDEDNIIIADSGNFRVEVFHVKGMFITTLIKGTNLIGPDVKPINVAVTKKNNVAVLLAGTGFCEVRVYSWRPNSSQFTV